MRTLIDVRLRNCVCLALIVAVASCKQAPGPENAGNAAEETTEAAGNTTAARDGQDVAVPLVPTGEVVFKAIADTDQEGVQVQAALRNGEPVPLSSAEWQASFITEFDAGDGPETCTSAMIGPGVMLTAAHCIPDSLKITFSYRGKPFAMDCVRHPNWETVRDPSADYGLCVLSDKTKPFTPPANFLYETVDLSPMASLAANRTPVILTGFGCTSNKVDQQRIDGRYRIGRNVVVATSDSAAPRDHPDNYFGPDGQRNNLFTADTGANICPGDSGGPAFTFKERSRRIIGVNSRVFYDPKDHSLFGTSLLAATGSADFGPWARKWLTDRGLSACGLSGAPRNCQS